MRNDFSKKLAKFLVRYSRVVILIALFIFFSVATDTFWSPTKWGNVTTIVLRQLPFTVLLAIAMVLSIILNGIDLSIGSNVALTSCVVAIVLRATHNAALGIITGIAMGIGVGLINGFLIAKVRVSGFISTYVLQWVLRGIALVMLAGKMIYDFGPDFVPLFTSTRFNFFILAAVITGILIFLFGGTVFGRQVYAIGKNEAAARISGINTDKVIIISYVISGVVVAIASMMYIANLGSAEPSIGSSFAMDAMAAALIGGTSFGGGKGKISDAVIGGFIMLMLTNGMIQMGVPTTCQNFVIGLVIIMAVFLEYGLEKIDAKVNAVTV